MPKYELRPIKRGESIPNAAFGEKYFYGTGSRNSILQGLRRTLQLVVIYQQKIR